MNRTESAIYRRERARGERASIALSTARTMAYWEHLESIGLVRFRWIPDEIPFDDSYIDTWADVRESERNRYRTRLWDMIERDGVWSLVGEYRLSPAETVHEHEGDDGWEHGGSVSDFVGTGPNGYESSIADETIDALRAALKSRCALCRAIV